MDRNKELREFLQSEVVKEFKGKTIRGSKVLRFLDYLAIRSGNCYTLLGATDKKNVNIETEDIFTKFLFERKTELKTYHFISAYTLHFFRTESKEKLKKRFLKGSKLIQLTEDFLFFIKAKQMEISLYEREGPAVIGLPLNKGFIDHFKDEVFVFYEAIDFIKDEIILSKENKEITSMLESFMEENYD